MENFRTMMLEIADVRSVLSSLADRNLLHTPLPPYGLRCSPMLENEKRIAAGPPAFGSLTAMIKEALDYSTQGVRVLCFGVTTRRKGRGGLGRSGVLLPLAVYPAQPCPVTTLRGRNLLCRNGLILNIITEQAHQHKTADIGPATLAGSFETTGPPGNLRW